MRTLWKRLLSGFLSLVLLATLVPTAAFAANDSGSGAAKPVNPFTDVKKGDWFYDAVLYAYANGFFSGTTANTYEPQGTMTRGMFVTVLGRMAGVDPADYSGGTRFSDVSPGKYYAAYIEWAVKYGIVTGYDDGTFRPDAKVTRQQMAAFFVRYFEAFGVDYKTGANITTTPADLASVSAYAQDAVLKLWKQGLLNGDGVNFNPGGNASRAQAATLCMRADKAVKTWYSEPGVPSERVSVDPAAQQPEQTEEEKKPSSSSGSSGSSGSSSRGHYTITLHMPDNKTDTMTQTSSTLSLDALPKPAPEGYYFLGWYYDEARTRQAMDGDPLSSNTPLYAKTLKSGEIETSETPRVAVKTDVETGFSITVKSTSPANDLRGKITFTGPEQYDKDTGETNILTVTKSSDGKTYTVSGPKGKLAEGGSYQVVLEDDALTFDEQAASIREYHFTVKAGDPVMNLHLKESVKEIPISAISNGARLAARSLSPVTVQAGENGSVTTNTAATISDTTGTFVYTAGTLAVGDTVAIYEGTSPESRGKDSSDLSNVSYVKITEVRGNNTYAYTAAETEDVVFTPDVLPIGSTWDTDGVPTNSSITISAANYTTAMSEAEAESLEAGDFLAFYQGDSIPAEGDDRTVSGYGCVTAVTEDPTTGSYTIKYSSATEDDVLASMNVTTANNVSGAELMKGVDEEALKKDIAKQAIDSGFAQLAARNIAAAVSTMDLRDLKEGELDLSDLDLNELAVQDLSFGNLQAASVTTYAETGAAGGSSGPQVEVSVKDVDIGTKLEHFDDKSGVRIVLSLEVTITFDAGEEDEALEITVTPTFVQELRLGISTKGGAEWRWKWGFIPYIYDFYARVSVDMYTYTSIHLDATISTTGDEDTVSKVSGLVSDIKDLVGKLKTKLAGKNIEVAEGITDLQDLYSQMLENDTEWITLYRKSISQNEWVVAKIIKINLDIDFVVQANVNISLGLEFEYKNAKRYVYNIYIFHGKATSNTIDIVPENYSLQLYAMGTLGIRAGVEICLSVSLISKEVASVGVIVDVGAYLKVYGYVIYKLSHTAGQKDTSSGSGALYIEVGCYLDIGMDISAFAGKLSWKPSLYSKEWPLWSAGSVIAVRGFAAAPEEDAEDPETPTLYMKKGQTTIAPSELLKMKGFNLCTGEDATAAFLPNQFDITFSDERFSLNDKGEIALEFGNGVTWETYAEPVIESDMTITWKGAPMSFNTETFQLQAKIHWDKLEDYYNVVFDVGAADKPMETMQVAPGAPLSVTEPTRAGYYFKGWTVQQVEYSGELTTLASVPATMPGHDLRLTANWELRTDIPYTIIPMFPTLDVNGDVVYDKNGEVVYQEGTPYTQRDGRIDTYIFPTLNEIDGYVTPGVGGYYINADGSTEIALNYTRRSYRLELHSGDTSTSQFYYYESPLDPGTPERAGYTFGGWYMDEGFNTELNLTKMPANDVEIYAKWTPNTDTKYTVNIYKEKPDGGYELDETNSKQYTGTTDTTVKPDLPTFDGYTVKNGTVLITIKGDGSAVGNYYYDLNRLALTIQHKSDNGKIKETETVAQVGTTLDQSTKSYAGYTREGYYSDETCTTAATYPARLTGPTTLYAKWVPDADTAYSVEIYLEGAEEDQFPETATTTQPKTGTTDTWIEKEDAPPQTGYSVSTFDRIQINGDGSTVARFYYYRNSYPLTLDYGYDRADSQSNVRYQTPLAPETPSRPGYAFDGWYTDSTLETKLEENATMPAEDLTLYAKWTANSGIAYKVEHWQQNAEGEDYTLADTDSLSGTAGQQTNAQANTYNGFTAQTVTQATIAGDGTTVVKVYYNRMSYTLTYDLNAGEDSSAKLENDAAAAVQYRHGATVSNQPSASRAGYTFGGWYTDTACTASLQDGKMPMKDTTLYAKWEAGNMSYTVNHYLQNLDGSSYPAQPDTTTNGSGNTGDQVTPQVKSYSGFDAPAEKSLTLSATESENVVNYYYTRKSFTVTWNAQNDEESATDTVRYGAAVAAPETDPTRTGYTFAGWYTDAACNTALTSDYTMPAANTTFCAKWEPITYTLRFNPLGNVPLMNWLLAQTGATPAAAPLYKVDGESDRAHNSGFPYIDFKVSYEEVFTLPAENSEVVTNSGLTGFTLSSLEGDYNAGYYEEPLGTSVTFEDALTKLGEEEGDIIIVDGVWPTPAGEYETPSSETNPTVIYNAQQLFEVTSAVGSGYYLYIKLAVDLDLGNGEGMAGSNTRADANMTFDGCNHSIKNMKRTNGNSGLLGGLLYGVGDSSTVKNLTIDGLTIVNTDNAMSYGAYGGLIGYVGKNFTMENVTVKNVSMTLELGATGSNVNDSVRIEDRDRVGGLIGYAQGSATLTNCSIDGLTISTTVNSSTSEPVVGSLIGYVDVLNSYDYETGWSFTNAAVTLTGCSVSTTGGWNQIGGIYEGDDATVTVPEGAVGTDTTN